MNECAYGAAICPSTARCVNTVGSYKCECKEGLISDESGGCLGEFRYCIQTQKGSKERLFITTRAQSMQIFGEIKCHFVAWRRGFPENLHIECLCHFKNKRFYFILFFNVFVFRYSFRTLAAILFQTSFSVLYVSKPTCNSSHRILMIYSR